jgi:diaminobutyrate-2-oxoglutarate transaminase
MSTMQGQEIKRRLEELAVNRPELDARVRGRGMIFGLELPAPGLAKRVAREAFTRKLVIELAGADDQVLKFLAPLTIDDDVLQTGIGIVADSLAAASR